MLLRLPILIALLWLLALPPATASAQELPELKVYSYFDASWGPGQVLKQEFEQSCTCNLQWVTFPDGGSMLARLQLEGEATKADVVVGLDQNLLGLARQIPIWQPAEIAAEIYRDLNPAFPQAQLGELANDKIFIPYDYGWFAFVYRKDKISNPPTSFTELAASNYSIVIQDPRSSTPGLGLLTWVQTVFGDAGAAQFWQSLSDQILTVTPGWSEAYSLFTSGEVDLVLSYTTSPAYHRIAEQDDNFDWLRFSEGHYLQLEFMAMTTQARDPDLARAFITFMRSTKAQRLLTTSNWMYPVSAVTVPDNFTIKPEPTSLPLVAEDRLLAMRKQWIAEWQQALR